MEVERQTPPLRRCHGSRSQRGWQRHHCLGGSCESRTYVAVTGSDHRFLSLPLTGAILVLADTIAMGPSWRQCIARGDYHFLVGAPSFPYCAGETNDSDLQ